MAAAQGPGPRTAHCPACAATLTMAGGDLKAWVCPNGHGAAATLPVARRRVADEQVNAAWSGAATSYRSGRLCPFCAKPMAVVEVAWDHSTPSNLVAPGEPAKGSVELELCRVDQLIWFDAGEIEALPVQSRPVAAADSPIIVNHWAAATDNLMPMWGWGSMAHHMNRMWGGW